MANSQEIKVVEPVSREERIIASKLFAVRTRMGIEREDLAAMTGIDEVDIAEYENGIHAIPASELFVIASAMGISINYFYGEYTSDYSASENDTDELPVLLS